ncbi:MAG: hypothetical protein ACK4K7_03250 [Allosphingosinicella sp.]|uniref:hypothetical protein n=1 Tax=Allosphingosinicella sp. TaxID=2823234 RepID=UPI003940DAAC
MTRYLSLALLPAALAACAPVDEGGRAGGAELAREIAGRAAGAEQDCVSRQQTSGLRIVDARTLVMSDGATLWVNRLDGDCPGLRPFAQLIVESHGSQLCRGDLVRGLEPGSTIPGPACPLGRFTPYRRP